jgi:hypothetical protein
MESSLTPSPSQPPTHDAPSAAATAWLCLPACPPESTREPVVLIEPASIAHHRLRNPTIAGWTREHARLLPALTSLDDAVPNTLLDKTRGARATIDQTRHVSVPDQRCSSPPPARRHWLPTRACFSSPEAQSRQDQDRRPPLGPRCVSPSIHGSAELHPATDLVCMSSFRRSFH